MLLFSLCLLVPEIAVEDPINFLVALVSGDLIALAIDYIKGNWPHTKIHAFCLIVGVISGLVAILMGFVAPVWLEYANG